MIEPWAARSADGAPDLFCERCGSPAGPDGGLQRVGLSTCQACGIHACPRCWARSVGACPACGVSIATTRVLRSLPDSPAPPPARTPAGARPRPRRARRAPAVVAAAGLLAVLAIAFASILAGTTSPAGRVAGIVGTPGA